MIDSPVMVVVAGHLPPPVEGMTIAVSKFVELLESAAGAEGGSVRVISTSGGQRSPRWKYQLRRTANVIGAAAALLRFRRTKPAVYISCDGGAGFVYTASLVALARLLGLRRYVHHHVYHYMRRRWTPMRVVTRLAGRHAVHLVGCERMSDDLRRLYPGVSRTRQLPILYAVDAGLPSERQRAREPVVLGHLSNLSAGKGLGETLATMTELRHRGIDASLVLAGPPFSSAAERRIQDLVQTNENASYLGPVYGEDRERFFSSIDVFLFPSKIDSFGLVAAEALARDVPVLAFETGCLSPEIVGDRGTVLPTSADFAAEAAAWVERYLKEPPGRPSGFNDRVRAAVRDASMLACEVVGGA